MIIIIGPKLNLLSLVLGCRYYKSLIKHVYQLPTYPCPPNYCFRVQTLPLAGSHEIFIFHQHLFRLLFVTHFTSLVKCVLILIQV